MSLSPSVQARVSVLVVILETQLDRREESGAAGAFRARRSGFDVRTGVASAVCANRFVVGSLMENPSSQVYRRLNWGFGSFTGSDCLDGSVGNLVQISSYVGQLLFKRQRKENADPILVEFLFSQKQMGFMVLDMQCREAIGEER
ncbi:hypothetical protein MUK42_25166 [Musa troglodytarum]|uniref:Uncharacterized protein n=1 Tax=Musa troglodytarum TaxID=320322 RepID=A0A9E7I4Q7_9LILI|nr:hypothetical protein MUK42_25166 [Musa troglodytarum]